MVLIAMGLITDDTDSRGEQQQQRSGGGQDVSSVTWAAIGSIGYCKPLVEEWRQSARESAMDDNASSQNVVNLGVGDDGAD